MCVGKGAHIYIGRRPDAPTSFFLDFHAWTRHLASSAANWCLKRSELKIYTRWVKLYWDPRLGRILQRFN